MKVPVAGMLVPGSRWPLRIHPQYMNTWCIGWGKSASKKETGHPTTHGVAQYGTSLKRWPLTIISRMELNLLCNWIIRLASLYLYDLEVIHLTLSANE